MSSSNSFSQILVKKKELYDRKIYTGRFFAPKSPTHSKLKIQPPITNKNEPQNKNFPTFTLKDLNKNIKYNGVPEKSVHQNYGYLILESHNDTEFMCYPTSLYKFSMDDLDYQKIMNFNNAEEAEKKLKTNNAIFKKRLKNKKRLFKKISSLEENIKTDKDIINADSITDYNIMKKQKGILIDGQQENVGDYTKDIASDDEDDGYNFEEASGKAFEGYESDSSHELNVKTKTDKKIRSLLSGKDLFKKKNKLNKDTEEKLNINSDISENLSDSDHNNEKKNKISENKSSIYKISEVDVAKILISKKNISALDLIRILRVNEKDDPTKIRFKEIVKRIATLVTLNNSRCLVLKDEFRRKYSNGKV